MNRQHLRTLAIPSGGIRDIYRLGQVGCFHLVLITIALLGIVLMKSDGERPNGQNASMHNLLTLNYMLISLLVLCFAETNISPKCFIPLYI